MGSQNSKVNANEAKENSINFMASNNSVTHSNHFPVSKKSDQLKRII